MILPENADTTLKQRMKTIEDLNIINYNLSNALVGGLEYEKLEK